MGLDFLCWDRMDYKKVAIPEWTRIQVICFNVKLHYRKKRALFFRGLTRQTFIFLEIISTDESFTIRPGMCITNVNRV